MADVINLRRARKARARSQKEEQAAQNRLFFGASKAERTSTIASRNNEKRQLDGHKIIMPIVDETNTPSDGEPS